MKRSRQEEFPSHDNREEDCAGNWREHPQLRTRNASKPLHLSPGVNERLIAKALTDADYSPQVGQRGGIYCDPTAGSADRSHAGPQGEGNGDPARRAVEIAAIGKLSH
jgi:hypothetical protein